MFDNKTTLTIEIYRLSNHNLLQTIEEIDHLSTDNLHKLR